MPGKDAMPGAREAAEVRRNGNLLLRMAGETYRSIAKTSGVSVRQAFEDVRRALVRRAKDTDREADRLQALDVARLDRLMVAHWTRAIGGDPQAAGVVLRIMERRAKLLGLDAPTKVDIVDRVRRDAIAAGLDPTEVEEALAEAQAIIRAAQLG